MECIIIEAVIGMGHPQGHGDHENNRLIKALNRRRVGGTMSLGIFTHEKTLNRFYSNVYIIVAKDGSASFALQKKMPEIHLLEGEACRAVVTRKKIRATSSSGGRGLPSRCDQEENSRHLLFWRARLAEPL